MEEVSYWRSTDVSFDLLYRLVVSEAEEFMGCFWTGPPYPQWNYDPDKRISDLAYANEHERLTREEAFEILSKRPFEFDRWDEAG
jgi:hypothetical protein